MAQLDLVEGEMRRRDWYQCDDTAVNEQSEPDPKRQCIEHAWTTQEDPYSFPSLGGITQTQDVEWSRRLDNTWAEAQDLAPVSNSEPMDVDLDFFNVENEPLPSFGLSLDLVQQPSGPCLRISEPPDANKSFPTPNSDCNFQDVQGKDKRVGFQDFELTDIFNVENDQPPFLDHSLDLAQKFSGSCLHIPEASDANQYVPTPNSDCNHSDVQPEMIVTPGTFSEDAVSTSQNLLPRSYDTCFGMIITSASCHSLPKETGDFIPVSVQQLGDILKLFGGKPNHNVGFLNSLTLGKLAREYTVTFSAKCEKTENPKNKRQTLGHKDTLVHIVIYGLSEEMNAVGNLLSEGGLFLQHPSHSDASVPYKNPQFLMAPGTEMPRIEDLGNDSSPNMMTINQCLGKEWANEVFQAFETVDGPAKFAPVESSPRLQTKLKEHQIKALSMMTEKERGVIEEADFPSLWEVLRDFDALIAWYLDSLPFPRTEPSTTLIITTLSTISGWEQQISRHFRPGQIRTAVFHGPHRRKLISGLLNHDIVITTYDTLRSEWSSRTENSVLFSNPQGWARVVLDEDPAHHIRSHTSQIFQATCRLHARYRWCLTGTPIHNGLDDYAALISFVGVPPFTGPYGTTAFATWLKNPIHTHGENTLGIKRLRKLIAATCLRRTKNHVQDQLKLTLRVEKEQLVELGSEERSLYDFFKFRASSLVVGNLTRRSQVDKARWGTMLSLIGLLRLTCNHGEQLLPAVATDLYHSRTLSVMNFQGDANDFELEGLDDPPISLTPDFPLAPNPPNEAIKANYRPSSKVNALLQNLQNEQRGNHLLSKERPIKSVIFSFWTKMLDLLEFALQANNFVFQRIDGKMSLEQRSLALTRLSEDSSCTVMLASIGSVAEGVDLTAASCVHMIEPQWNPMVEAQALDRVHRIGQVRDVTVTRYIVKDSIELYVQAIQQNKLKLVQQSFNDKIPDQLTLSESRFQKLLEVLE
ncbi:Helicase C-terminal [Penicillium robsamsonii]|uniref:Helicase C-terminal n=1 Tax=Penicillium robsamsonii TaxID=1792511 RepID=UPI00254918B6|nr:Helicase C-terminal [Penicillium robsamsonii]KAJ5826599.1 Helicase C-terminal [Penicillium robsamsonii]